MEISNSFFVIMSIITVFGYLLVLLQDVFLAAGRPALSRIGWIGYAGTLFPLAAVPYAVPYAAYMTKNLAYLLWTIACMLGMLLVYSIAIEPVRSRYRTKRSQIQKNNDDKNDRSTGIPCYTGGTYSFSRHPGFIWFTLINLLYTVMFFHYKILVCMLLYTAMNFIVIALEDAVFFPKIFSDYREYRKKTRFII